ncbi:MAG: hypothetical protein HS111_33215 [Kofleriaceae bacterium]|nr:hypothetical protein [Kofleriaceae bacterium]
MTVDAASPTVVAVVPGGDAGPPPADGSAPLDAGIDAAATLTRGSRSARRRGSTSRSTTTTPRQTPETLSSRPAATASASSPRLGVTRTVVIDVLRPRPQRQGLDAP